MGVKLIAAMTLLSVVTLVASAVAINNATSSELETEVSDGLVAQANLEGKHLASALNEQVNLTIAAVASDSEVLEAIEKSNASYTGTAKDIEQHILDLDAQWQAATTDIPLIQQTVHNPIADHLRLFLKRFPQHSEIFVTDRYGAEIAGSDRTSDYYQADEEWWQKGWNNGKGAVYFGSPEFDQSAGVLAIAITVPITDGDRGEVLGVLKTVYNITALSQNVGSFAIGRGSKAYLIDGKGNFVGGVPLEQIGKAAPPAFLLNGRIFSGSGYDLNAQNETGQSVVVGYTPVSSGSVTPEIDQLGWVILIEQDRAEAFAPIVRLRTAAGVLTLLAVLLAAAVALWLGHSLTRELAGLTKAASEFGAGNLSVRAPIDSRDEIGKLGVAFNAMADQVSQLIGGMERSVVEAQAARERAERSDQVKSAFLASVSHELRTPLNAIINYTKFVVKGVMGPTTERQTETLNKVIDSGKHLLNLINDVLDISKIESGSLTLFVEDNVDLKDVLQTTYSTAKSLLSDKPVELKLEMDDALPLLMGDKQRIRQIMLNLVSNACKFTETGFIKICAHQKEDAIQIAVQDSGPGIAAEEYDAVFQTFKQTETGLRQGSGTGLGMPISRSLAEAHGGRLWFESKVGEGSTFYVTLPVKSSKLTPTLV